jgi:hypothetical protein
MSCGNRTQSPISPGEVHKALGPDLLRQLQRNGPSVQEPAQTHAGIAPGRGHADAEVRSRRPRGVLKLNGRLGSGEWSGRSTAAWHRAHTMVGPSHSRAGAVCV